MEIGHYTPVRPLDNPEEHIPVHKQALQQGDPFKLIGAHLLEHEKVLMAHMAQQQQAPQPGAQGPGARPGAQPSPGRPAQNPPGAIHPDQMGHGDPSAMPPGY